MVAGFLLFAVFNNITNVAIKRSTDSGEHLAVVANYLVFVIIINDLEANTGSLRQLITCNAMAIQIRIKR